MEERNKILEELRRKDVRYLNIAKCVLCLKLEIFLNVSVCYFTKMVTKMAEKLIFFLLCTYLRHKIITKKKKKIGLI